MELHHSRRHHAQDQNDGGRRISRLKNTVDQDGSVVDNDFLKQQVRRHHKKIESAQQKYHDLLSAGSSV